MKISFFFAKIIKNLGCNPDKSYKFIQILILPCLTHALIHENAFFKKKSILSAKYKKMLKLLRL